MKPTDEQFVEKMGLFFEADGLPRISGRVLGLLLLTPGECSLDDLAELLQVSKASVSTNTRLLDGMGIVERASRPGDRRDYYRIAHDMQGRMLERRIERMRGLNALIEEGQRTVTVEDPEVQARLRTLNEFHMHAIRGMEEGLQHLRACQAGGYTPGAEES
ncbi:MAG: MarR family transcriptional regulator [Gemmatimonadota bacterium]|jgi:DNA-binding transcriptional regulator GbsR (MarR family)|nr:MarR family transcriptional regulator [Gemmatimonadota bacterium]